MYYTEETPRGIYQGKDTLNNTESALHVPTGVIRPVYHYVYRGAER